MDDRSSSSPDLTEMLNQHFSQLTADLHTCLPAIVQSYDPTAQTVDVLPALLRKYKSDDSPVSLPVVQQVPVVFPSLGNSWLLMPVTAGDTGMLLFSERSLDIWFEKGGQVDPAMPRRFALADAVFVPGLRPRPGAIARKGAVDSLELTYKGTWLEITAAGKVRLTNGNQDLLGILNDLLQALKVATVIGLPFDAPALASFAVVENALSNLKA